MQGILSETMTPEAECLSGDTEAEAGEQEATGARQGEPTVSIFHLALEHDWFSFLFSFFFLI